MLTKSADILLEKVEEMENLGLDEIIASQASWVLVEWAEKLGSLLPKDRTDITFETLGNGNHTIWIKKQ